MTRNERVARQLMHGRINRRIERIYNTHIDGHIKMDAEGHSKVFDAARQAIALTHKISDPELAKIIVDHAMAIGK